MRYLLLASVALVWSGPAFAQQAQVDQTETAPSEKTSSGTTADALSDVIIVTATKKGYGENLQNVPVAVTAFGEAQLDAKFVQNLQSLSYDVPNVQLEGVGTAPGYANFTIRGLGINSTVPSIDPTVGVFTDGIYLGINAGVVLDNFDLEGIEVLRGPQGLLFGRNVTAGAVVMRTTRPDFNFRASAKASVETGLKKTVSAMVTGPIAEDVLAAKLAVYYSKDEGWFRNQFDQSSFGKSRDIIIRPALSVKGGDNFRMDLRYEHGDIDGDGAPVQSHAIFPRDTFGISIDFPGYYNATWNQAIAETNIDVGLGDGVITNIMGYRQFRSRAASDIDGTPQHFFNGYFNINQEQISDELRYSGKIGAVEVTTGLYYFAQDLAYAEQRDLLGGARIVSGGGTQDQTTWGAFASADWHFSNTLTLNIGGRYSWERKAVRIAPLGANGCDVNTLRCATNFIDDESWKSFTPKLGLQWQPDNQTQIYGFYTRGFRSGGYNLRNTDPGVPPGPFDQETQDSFEIGAKKQFGRSRLNIASFYNQMKNLQREINLPGPLGVSQVIRNTADATITGFEAEGQFFIMPNLVLSGQVGYVHGKYRNIQFDISGDGVINDVDRDLKLPRLSPWTYGAGLTYDQTLGSAGTATARIDFTHRDSARFTDNNAGFLSPADMLDASLTYKTADQIWRFSVYGRNLLNEVTYGGDTPLPAAFGGPGASLSPLNKGRTIGGEVALSF
ncbi:TonB-dependent receptor [Citromicrobium bathyomarinum]|jgi:iron complex outermembrane receptor protein|uniref:TonB-dependent receptor n=1 Tax=Sphingomonadales TaxID=204457 RepID=UPI0002EF6A68|nr:TonB-dependent receptor [Erythrobacter litoralis]KZX53044.1 ligand-gated channel [Erythrobacter sp. HI00D59]MAO15830.1 TonB-dependent receptor [Allomuricauda sp.]OAN86547.1 ligand-gated channel [Erythrobacter sp. EhN03]|tara:strand:+ start:15120 stop:17303 length:2184 start_codon:yes stop_codon:yes gene_type:complete